MVLIYGSKGEHDRLGYILGRCPSCNARGVFTVEQVKRRFTLYFVPTFSYDEQQLLFCISCHTLFEVSAEDKEELKAKLMSKEQVTNLISRLDHK